MTSIVSRVFTTTELKTSSENYQRLAKSLSGMSSLWKGEDHLVYVRGSGFLLPFTEEYKRYRYRDIQVISIGKKSRVGMAILYTMALITFVVPVILILSLADSFGTGMAIFVSMLSLASLFFACLLVRHLILGPVCVCDIQTSLSRDRIRPLNRFHRANEIAKGIENDIRESQKHLLETEAERIMVTQAAATKMASRFSVPVTVVPTSLAVMIFGLGCLAAIHLESLAIIGFLLFLILVVSVLLIVSLISSVRKATPDSIRAVLWVLLGMLFLFVGSAVVFLFLATARDPSFTIGVTGPLEAFTGVATEEGLVFYLIALGLSIGLFGGGLFGLVDASRWKKKLAVAGEAGAGVETKKPDPGDG